MVPLRPAPSSVGDTSSGCDVTAVGVFKELSGRGSNRMLSVSDISVIPEIFIALRRNEEKDAEGAEIES